MQPGTCTSASGESSCCTSILEETKQQMRDLVEVYLIGITHFTFKYIIIYTFLASSQKLSGRVRMR
jgi:hypothetical protein